MTGPRALRRFAPPVVGCSVVAGLGTVVASPTVALAGPILVWYLWLERRRRRRVSAEVELVGRLPHLLDGMLQLLRSGHSLRHACSEIERLDPLLAGSVLAPLVDGLRRRSPLTDSLAAVLAGRGSTDPGPETRLLAVTLLTLAGNGGPAVPALQRLRHTLSGAVNGRRRARAEAAQASASAALLVFAPAIFVVLVGTLDSSAARFYLRERAGAVCAVTAVVLSGLGWWWMQRLIERSERAAW